MIAELSGLLKEAGYAVSPQVSQGLEVIYFEDSALIGFAGVFETIDELLNSHEALASEFLSSNATRLRIDPVKAWNVYSVFLAKGETSPDQLASLNEIEEDLVGTRKIARGGIRTIEDVRRALSPILPLRYLQFTDSEVQERLRSKLTSSELEFAEVFSDPTRPLHELLEWLKNDLG